MARSFIHEPKTAPMAPHICSSASSGKSLPVRSLTAFLKRLTSSLRSSTFSSVSSLTPLACLSSSMMCSNGSISVLVLRLEAEDDVAVHLHEAAIAVPGEAFVAGLVDQAAQGRFVEADVEDRVHHAGHARRGRRSGRRRAADSWRSPNLAPMTSSVLRHGLLDLGLAARADTCLSWS